MEQLTLEKATELCYSNKHDYPQIFKDNCGLDIVGKDRNSEALHAVKGWSNKRRVTLEIRTWVGISFGAIHYYGKLKVDGVSMEYDEKPGIHTSIDSDKQPLADWYYELKIHRHLTQKEIEEDPDRWEAWYEGSHTECFETVEEIVEFGKQIFKLRFEGDWELWVEYPWGRKEQVVFEESEVK